MKGRNNCAINYGLVFFIADVKVGLMLVSQDKKLARNQNRYIHFPRNQLFSPNLWVK